MPGPRKLLKFVANEPVLAILVVALVLLQCLHPRPWRELPHFMFVVLRSVEVLPSIKATIAALGIDTPLRAFVAGAVLSQGISNVPAASRRSA